jgi:hypothetical protein
MNVLLLRQQCNAGVAGQQLQEAHEIWGSNSSSSSNSTLCTAGIASSKIMEVPPSVHLSSALLAHCIAWLAQRQCSGIAVFRHH